MNQLEKLSKSQALQAIVEILVSLNQQTEVFNALFEAVQLTKSLVSRDALFQGFLFKMF